MKSKQKGEVVVLTAVTYLVLAFAAMTVPHAVKGEKAPEAKVQHNYNGGFSK